jgi:hypothetical protein
MSRYNENFIAVGVTNNADGDNEGNEGVVIVVAGLGKFTVNQHGARKLADDILRNANWLWPETEESEK